MLAEVREGFGRTPKELPPKYFYDAPGSRLFEEITRLPEYYLTRTELGLLKAWIPGWLGDWRPRSFVELGAGSAEKSRLVLDAMTAENERALYVPVDLSEPTLDETARRLRAEYPGLDVAPVVADISTNFEFPRALPRPVLYAFLGSTLGNFKRPRAVALLSRIRKTMRPSDRFLLGADLKKDVATLEAAYNDARGVTAAFNRNILRVLNRELGADFDVMAFEHRALYDAEAAWIEMHLVSSRDQEVTIPGLGAFRFVKGEPIRTEISCKYDRESVTDLFTAAELEIEEWKTDSENLYALALASPSFS
ncbi:MAG: L-histidine N(alpha)-methyltransferase [Gemmatimonadetes bacterium]|nr:L-histidine N(alpha)-methyltransferase [Gemmatimonadota bacterium]